MVECLDNTFKHLRPLGLVRVKHPMAQWPTHIPSIPSKSTSCSGKLHANAMNLEQRLIREVNGDAFPELLNALKYRVTTKRILAEYLGLAERAIAFVQVGNAQVFTFQ